MPGSYVVAGARTPIGKLSGAFAGLSGTDLGGAAIAAAIDRSGITPDQVDYVVMGQVLQAGAGQITARQAAVNAGIPMTVAATTINKVCLSGLNAIQIADMLIETGQAEIVVAGGMESMTNAPYLLPGARSGYRAGDKTVVDSSVTPLGEVLGYGQVAGPDASLLTQPSRAIHDALQRCGRSLDEVGLFEINEAFAAVALASMADLGIGDDVVNVNGGAIALGHPIGASGNRLALTLLHEMHRRGTDVGAAALCGGGGQGDALILGRVS